MNESIVFIISGMHRSGTSLTASLLQSAGVHVGDNLVGASEENQKGHFEDIDFVELNKQILASNGLSEKGWEKKQVVDVSEEIKTVAKAMVTDKSKNKIWGWKDPRSILLLDFWKQILPDAIFILVYRSPWEVVDSLYRRCDPDIIAKPSYAVELWLSYNQIILNFYKQNVDNCLLINIEDVSRNRNALIQKIRDKFNVNLESPDIKIFDKSLMKGRSDNSRLESIILYFYPQVIKVYSELLTASNSLHSNDIESFDSPDSLTIRNDALEFWMQLRMAERKSAKHRKSIVKQEKELDRLRKIITSYRSSVLYKVHRLMNRLPVLFK